MATYKPLQSLKLTADTASVTFSGVDQSYTDLVIVYSGKVTTAGESVLVRFNGDTTVSYSISYVYGTGSSAASYRRGSMSYLPSSWLTGLDSTNENNLTFNIQNYSSTTTYKSILERQNNVGPGGTPGVVIGAGWWQNNSAINNIQIYMSAGNFAAGSTFSLYGIKSGAPQALGGDYTVTDGNYWYHVFKATGAFTPLKSLTADILVVAGGGGGGGTTGGGGGAGGLLGLTSQSLTAQAYTVTIGGGGAGSSTNTNSGSNGVNSQFGALTAAVGGGGGVGYDGGTGATGGSGGGSGGFGGTPGNGTSGQGNAGGAGAGQLGGGGGGAGAVGSGYSGYGAGGAGSSAYSSWGVATSSGQNVSGTYYFAGGGGGGLNSQAGGNANTALNVGGYGGGGRGGTDNGPAVAAGTANTGGGGGGGRGNGSYPGAAGGSGIVIVRYAV